MRFILQIDVPETLTKVQISELEYLLEHAIEEVNPKLVDVPELGMSEEVKKIWHDGFDVSIEKE